MSTDLFRNETVVVTRFFGGVERGACYQITQIGNLGKDQPDSWRPFLQLPTEDARLAAEAILADLGTTSADGGVIKTPADLLPDDQSRYSLKRVTDLIELADTCLRAGHPPESVLHDVIYALAHLADYIAAKERGDV